MRTQSALCLLTLLTLTNISFALTPTLGESISGNPIARQDNYTINSQRRTNATVTCVFTNNSDKPATINIWTSPSQTHPVRVVRLKPAPAQDNKPFTSTQTLHLDLNPVWWCSIYPKHDKRDWKYCHYLSISDATISEYHAFGTWNKTIRSKKTRYDCKITRVRPKTATPKFFYFK